MRPRSRRNGARVDKRQDITSNEDEDSADFESFLEEVTASESSEEERPIRKKSPRKKPAKAARPKVPDRQPEKKPQKRPGRPKLNKNGDVPAKKNKIQPVKVKIEDEAQLMSKGRRSIKPTKFSEYVMLIDSSENEMESSDGYSSADSSSVDMPAAKSNKQRRGRHRINESGDDSSDGQRKAAKSRGKYMTLKERIKLLKRFDALQPCSPMEAADIFGISGSLFSSIIAERETLKVRYESAKSRLPKDDLETLKEALADFARRTEAKKQTFTKEELRKKAEELKRLLDLSKIEVTDDWIDTFKIDFEDSKKKLAQAQNSARLETALSRYVETSQKNGVEPSWDEIKAKCQSLKVSLGITGVDVTEDWLSEWKKKFDKPAKRPYRPRKPPSSFVCGEDEEKIDDWSGAVRAALRTFHPDDIFNAVESGIYYKSLPGLHNSETDWMTVFFACNMSGIEKKRLLVIGKSTDQLSLGILTLPVDFVTNDNAWMTPEIFTSFVTDWDLHLGQSERRIALIVEESSAHPRANLSWIDMFFVPKNACNLAPLKRGVVSLVKNLYRKELMQAVKKLAADSRRLESTAEKISIVDAAFMLSSAWAAVEKSSMVTAFVQSGFPFLQKSCADENEENPDESRLNAVDEQIAVHEQHRDVHAALLADGHCINEVILHADDEIDPMIDSESQDEFRAPDVEESIKSGVDCEKSEANRPSDVFLCKPEVMSPTLNPTSSPSSLTEDTVWSVGQTASELPSDSKVLDALATIKRFLKSRNGNLEDLSDYTQLELKVLAKLQS